MTHDGSNLFDESLIARRRVRRWTALAVGVVVLLRMLGEVAPVMRRPDLLLLDTWQSIRAPHASNQVVIVAIDERSIGPLGPPPWPRSEYVPLVERLARAEAKVIGFDFTFGALEREAANNTLFAEAMKKAGNVVFGYEFTRVNDPSPPGVAPSSALQLNALASNPERVIAIRKAPELIEPEPSLAEAAAAIGHVRVEESREDGRLRMLQLIIQHGPKSYPSLGLQLARLYQGVKLDDVKLGDGVVSIGPLDVPIKPTGEVLLNWPAEGALAFPRYSFLDVVRGDVPDDAFRGKVVLVAGTASGLDDRDFPFANKAPGVLVYATFLDNLFRGDFVRDPEWAFVLEWLLFLCLCGLAVWLLPRLPTRVLLAGVPLLALVLIGAGAFAFVVQKASGCAPSTRCWRSSRRSGWWWRCA